MNNKWILDSIESQERARKLRIRRQRMQAQKEGQMGRMYLRRGQKDGLSEIQQENLRLWMELGITSPKLSRI